VTYHVGLDLGQASDYTAIAVVKKVVGRSPDDGKRSVSFHLEHLERVREVPYPEIADKVAALMRDERLFAKEYDREELVMHKVAPRLVVDAQGVGRPVVDLLKQRGLRPKAVAVHGGDATTTGTDGFLRLPKRDLIMALQVALQTGQVKDSCRAPLLCRLPRGGQDLPHQADRHGTRAVRRLEGGRAR
jgi:hypothetical protein